MYLVLYSNYVGLNDSHNLLSNISGFMVFHSANLMHVVISVQMLSASKIPQGGQWRQPLPYESVLGADQCADSITSTTLISLVAGTEPYSHAIYSLSHQEGCTRCYKDDLLSDYNLCGLSELETYK